MCWCVPVFLGWALNSRSDTILIDLTWNGLDPKQDRTRCCFLQVQTLFFFPTFSSNTVDGICKKIQGWDEMKSKDVHIFSVLPFDLITNSHHTKEMLT
jgi:hypothetical protein